MPGNHVDMKSSPDLTIAGFGGMPGGTGGLPAGTGGMPAGTGGLPGGTGGLPGGTGGLPGGTGGMPAGTGGMPGLGGSAGNGTTCHDLLGADPTKSMWLIAAPQTYFGSSQSYSAWYALNQCACVTASGSGGCAGLCTGTGEFCNGHTPNVNTACYGCLNNYCASQLAACAAN
jgi:hypothetical protein